MEGFCGRLIEERKRLKYNQTDFGTIGGVTQNSQSNYEIGKRHPDAPYLAAIAAVGADIGYIITGVRSCPADSPPLSSRVAALLEHYQRCDEADKIALERLASTAAQLKQAR